MINKFKTFEKVYPFTNENLTAYSRIYDFKDKNVLSVVGSGDQYFSSLLFGARNICLFDINSTTKYLFALKFYSIKVLTYEEFKIFFVDSKLDNLNLYNKVKCYLPSEVKYFFDYIISHDRKLSNLIYTTSLNSAPINYNSDRVVPYFEKENYYILKEILNNVPFPKIYNLSINDLYLELNEIFDIMLFSNIFLYLNMNVESYKVFLKNYLKLLNSSGVIQSYYSWTHKDESIDDFIKSGFCFDVISSIRYNSDKKFEDYVLSLRKNS